MNKGARVIVARLESERGVVYESVRNEYEKGVVGVVKRGVDVIGNVEVLFPSVSDGKYMDLPMDILERATP